MRRIAVVVFLVLCVFVASVFAGQQHSTGAFKASTVAEAKASGIDTDVILTGHFVKMIKDGSFVFSDTTGELLVHVAEKQFDKETMSKAEIEVIGKIVQNLMYTEVQATSIALHN